MASPARLEAWAYMTDAYGGIQHLLALEYGSGKMRLQHCLPALLEKIMLLFGIKGNKYRHLRKRTVIRIDAGGGTPRNMGSLEGSGFSYFLKGYSYHVARQVCNGVSEWHKIPGKEGGFLGLSSRTDLPNLKKFCDPVPELTVFGFRQVKEDGKVEQSHYITNVPDYMRLSVDGTNKYAKAFFQKVREKSIGQLLLPLSRQAQFQQSLFSLRL